MAESHENFKEYKRKQQLADRYKSPERQLDAERSRRNYESSKREEEKDNERASRLLDWGSMD